MKPASQVTLLIERWVGGDMGALDQLIPFVYDRLRELAHQRRRSLPPGASVNTTELVHEAYLKLAHAGQVNVRDRCHFLALASRVMRNLLVDHARARQAAKRDRGKALLDPTAPLELPEERLEMVTALHEALQQLEKLDARQSRILEQRYFGGLSLEDTAASLGVSLATVKRELRVARAWLNAQLRAEPLL